MCWCIDKDKNPEVYHKTAHEDIEVYKIGYKKHNEFIPIYHSNFTYIANSLNKELNLVAYKEYEYYSIDEGYHSFINKQIAFDASSSSILFGSNVGKFIIPKGSEYYENDLGEIVSSQIIWTGEYYKSKDIKSNTFKQIESLQKSSNI